MQAERAVEAAAWRAGSSGRYSAAKNEEGNVAFMCDGDTANNGKKTWVQQGDVATPVNAVLLSRAPKAAPLPAQPTVDSRLATCAAWVALRSEQHLGPGSYEAKVSDFGLERSYVRVQPPKSVNGLGLPKGTSRGQLISALVKRWRSTLANGFFCVLLELAPSGGPLQWRVNECRYSGHEYDADAVKHSQYRALRPRTVDSGTISLDYSRGSDRKNAVGTVLSRAGIARSNGGGGLNGGQPKLFVTGREGVTVQARFGPKGAGRATMRTDSSRMRHW